MLNKKYLIIILILHISFYFMRHFLFQSINYSKKKITSKNNFELFKSHSNIELNLVYIFIKIIVIN